MRIWKLWPALILWVGCASCSDSLNTPGPMPSRFAITSVTLNPSAPAGGYTAGATVTATVSFQGVSPPFTVTLAFPNGGATPATQTVIGENGTAAATFTVDSFLLADDPDGKDVSFVVTATDGNGVTGSLSGSFHLVGTPSQMPDDGEGDPGAPPDPESEPEPEPVDPDAERLARISSQLINYGDWGVKREDLVWIAKYWEENPPEQAEPTAFPIQGKKLVKSVDFTAPDILMVSLHPGYFGNYNMVMASSKYGEVSSGWPVWWKDGSFEHELHLHFRLIGPPRESSPLTVHVSNGGFGGEELVEDLVVHIPVPELDLQVEVDQGNRLRASLSGDDAPDEDGEFQFGLGVKAARGASLAGTMNLADDSQRLEREFAFDFLPRGPHPPAAVFSARSAYWRYRTELVEFTNLPVKGWQYDYVGSKLHVEARNDTAISLALPDGTVLAGNAPGPGKFDVPSSEASYAGLLTATHPGGVEKYAVRLGNAACSLPPNTLRAWPLEDRVRAGEPVRIMVASGMTWEPFMYMTGARVVVPEGTGMRYHPNSFNVGSPGGVPWDVDGGWEAMNPGNFLLAPDVYIGGWGNNIRVDKIDFNVTPLEGREVYFEGELFNFEAVFSTPGVYDIGFEEVETVNRCYYQDSNQAPDYFWDDVSNAPVDGLPSGRIIVE